ncbi:hypothetical protein HZH66_005265 [Vespula vulgaris]|uniref:Uncharacterized protein n=1 Tax=Vespula vulgaris TaxID=7454 RepID=A0A834KA66_VESVU|nr:hypothetical protein HZH66_005265 [Vespula vulgaris]
MERKTRIPWRAEATAGAPGVTLKAEAAGKYRVVGIVELATDATPVVAAATVVVAVAAVTDDDDDDDDDDGR